MRTLITRSFQVLMAIVAGLCIYEILAIGYGIATGDMSFTITKIVIRAAWSTVAAMAVAITFGVGLAVHFLVERRSRSTNS